MRRLSIVISFLVVLLLPGSLWAFWPLWWEFDGEKHLLGPLISYQNDDGKDHLTVRPLCATYDSPRDFSFLWPLGKSTKEESYFLPIYRRHDVLGKYDIALFPFFYGNTGEKSYWGVFPIYGKMYGRFRRDEIGFALWPLYGYSVSNGATKRDYIWPIFSSYSGTQEGFKIGPLYGQHKWGEDRRSWFVLLPFFIRDERNLTSDNPKSSYWALPFYMQTTSPKEKYYGVLWPFFTYAKIGERTELSAPWPFYSRTTGKDYYGYSIYPFYSYYNKNGDEVSNIFGPFYKESERHPGDKTWKDKRVLLLNRYVVDDRGSFLNVWPFFEYRAKDENRRVFIPSIIPWRDAKYDRIMRPLTTLYEFRQEKDKTATNLLYGLYTKEQTADSWTRRVAFLFEMKHGPKGYGFQVLSGLLGIDPDRFKLLYIPVSRDTGRDE